MRRSVICGMVLLCAVALVAADCPRTATEATNINITLTLNGDCVVVILPVGGPRETVQGVGGETRASTRGDVTVRFSLNCSSATVTGPIGTDARPG